MATSQDKAAGIAALQGALAAEHTAIYGYGVAGALMRGNDQGVAMSYWTLHRMPGTR